MHALLLRQWCACIKQGMRICVHGVEDDGTPRTLVADIDMNGQDRQIIRPARIAAVRLLSRYDTTQVAHLMVYVANLGDVLLMQNPSVESLIPNLSQPYLR